jgi:hypothetical protein
MGQLQWEKYIGNWDAWSGRAAYKIVPGRSRAILMIDRLGSGMKYFGEYATVPDAKQAAQKEDDRLALLDARRGAAENPLSSGAKTALGVALVGGMVAAIYYATRPAATTVAPSTVAGVGGRGVSQDE